MGPVDPSKPHLFRRHKLSEAMNPVRVWEVIPNTRQTMKCTEYGCGWIQMATRCQGGTHIESQEHARTTRRKRIRATLRDIKEYLCHQPPPGGWSSVTGEQLGIRGDKCAPGNNGASPGGCSYDFETQTFLDEDGNRWATNEYNKLVE